MDRHVKWLRRRIIASIATQTAEVFAVVAVAAFALMYWRTSEGPVTSLFGAVVIAQLVAVARVGHAMRNNPLNYVFMRKYVERPFAYRVSRFQGEEEAHPVAERLPGFAPVATIRDSEADPEPIFDVYHDPSRLVAASISRASGSVALISSLDDGRIMVTDSRAMPPHERLVMNVASEDTLDSVISTHRRAISARSDVSELASSAHKVVLDSLAVEYDSYVALGPTLSPFLDLEAARSSWLRLSARIKPEELAGLPARLGPDMAPRAARKVTPEQPAMTRVPEQPPVPTAPVPEVVAPALDAVSMPVPKVLAPAPDVVVPDVAALVMAEPDVVVPDVAALVMAEPVAVVAELEPVAVAPEPEPVAVVAELEPVAVAPEPEPVAVVAEPEPVAVAPSIDQPATGRAVGAASLEPTSMAPALSAVNESDVVALVIPDPRKNTAPATEAPAKPVAVSTNTIEVPPVGPTPFITLEPEHPDVEKDPAPVTAEVPAVVIDAPPDHQPVLSSAPVVDPVVAAPVPQPAGLQPALRSAPVVDPVVSAPVAMPEQAMPEMVTSLETVAMSEPIVGASAGPVGPPATLAEAVQPAPDTAAALVDDALRQAPPADWHRPADPAPSLETDLPNLASALAYADDSTSTRPRLSAVLRANNATRAGASSPKRSRRKTR